MKKLLLLAASYCVFLSIAGCGNNKPKPAACPATDVNGRLDTSKEALFQTVRAIESKLKASPTLETYTGNLAITAYLNYAKYFPADTLSTAFLFNAGNLASNIGQSDKAISIYEEIIAKYPKSRFVPKSLFLEGFLYDSKMKDTANARKKYMELINNYPNDSLTIQAKQVIKYLGVSDEDLGKKFEEMNKAKNKEYKKVKA
jgi:tetratricopeptide (TPR) repeat protein